MFSFGILIPSGRYSLWETSLSIHEPLTQALPLTSSLVYLKFMSNSLSTHGEESPVPDSLGWDDLVGCALENPLEREQLLATLLQVGRAKYSREVWAGGNVLGGGVLGGDFEGGVHLVAGRARADGHCGAVTASWAHSQGLPLGEGFFDRNKHNWPPTLATRGQAGLWNDFPSPLAGNRTVSQVPEFASSFALKPSQRGETTAHPLHSNGGGSSCKPHQSKSRPSEVRGESRQIVQGMPLRRCSGNSRRREQGKDQEALLSKQKKK